MSSHILELVWNNIIVEARLLTNSEPILNNFLHTNILKHKNFKHALINIIFQQLIHMNIYMEDLKKILIHIYNSNDYIIIAAANDIYAAYLYDPSVKKYLTPFLYLKGFHVLQMHRIIHWLWNHKRQELAMYLYKNTTTYFNVDIHPAVKIGYGIMLDHATGIVIGETTIIEDNVAIMQSVTLGSTGKIHGNRHPKIKQKVMIGAGSIILGNIEIGIGAKIGAGSVVLHSVPPYSTVTGQSAQLIYSKSPNQKK